MLQLYYSPGACSMAAHVVLNELGLPFEPKKVDLGAGEQQTPEFLAINPRGQVPVLVADGQVIREGAAIILYLMDEYNSSLIPRSGRPRATALEWLMFGNATLHPAYSRISFILKNVTDPAQQDALFRIALEKVNSLWAGVDAHLAKNRFTCGMSCTAADILLAVMANWGGKYPQPVTLGTNVKRMLREVIARPSYQKALKTEQVEYKAAA